MFLLELHYHHTRLNGSGEIHFYSEERSENETRINKKNIKKWTFLQGGAQSTELLKLMAVACLGYEFLPCFEKHLDLLNRFDRESTELNPRVKEKPVLLESCQVRHAPRDCPATAPLYYASGFKIVSRGEVVKFRADEYQYAPADMPKKHPRLGSGIRKNFVLACGPQWKSHSGTDCFDFSQPYFRTVRFLSLFVDHFSLTDPVTFLQRLHYRTLKGRKPAINTLKLVSALFKQYFFINSDAWLDREIDFNEQWRQLKVWQKKLVIPILDMVRHVIDASPHDLNPCARTGVILLALPETYCPKERFVDWLTVLNELFPNMQFVLSLFQIKLIDEIPKMITNGLLKLPQVEKKSRLPTIPKLGKLTKDTVVLIDVDSRMPNLALMKLSTYFKWQGRKVVLVRRDKWKIKSAEEVYASSVFNFKSSLRRVEKLRKRFGEKITIGGSGVDIKLRLPGNIEHLPSDYELYPELSDRAIGFLTRGCPRKCPFCLVPEKEGDVRQVASLDDLLHQRNKLILLDDNFLAHPEADMMLEEMAEKDIQVNFNQSLDILFMSRSRASLLKKIRCSNAGFNRSNYYFSLNGNGDFEQVRRNYEMFDFRRGDNVQFICMYGYNTTLAEDVERFRFIRSLPGAYVFVQKYRPVIGRSLTRNI
ncbi:MAG: radical SAM protein, partial [Pseudomonadota bacterium]|nr:radical SAM protein [Pseudomonadota bacterium]